MDTVEVTLPVCQKTAVIRNYTTHKDDSVANSLLFANVTADQKGEMNLPLANVMASAESYVPRLVQSIGDSTEVHDALDALHSKDFDVIEQKVAEIVEENSPKAREAKKASKNATI